MWLNIVLVGTGSMLGGISRYLLSDLIRNVIPSAFPVGIFIVNVLGCFLIGVLSGFIGATNTHKLFFAVGFCGSFTTFSTFSLDNLNLISTKAYFLLSLNIGLSVVCGLIATWLGYVLSQKILS